MKQIRKRLTYANVMSSIAVFLVLGGATAIAAKKIGSNEIKSNAITAGKIKKNAVTTAKIKNNAVTGAKVNESTLGQVPSALNADTVGGQSAHKLRTLIPEGQSNVTVATVSGFTISASCGVNDIDVTITPPSGPGSILMAGGVPQTGSNVTTNDWAGNKPGETGAIQVDELSAGGDATYGISSVSLTTTDGAVVSGTLAYDYDAFENSTDCIVFGHLLAG